MLNISIGAEGVEGSSPAVNVLSDDLEPVAGGTLLSLVPACDPRVHEGVRRELRSVLPRLMEGGAIGLRCRAGCTTIVFQNESGRRFRAFVLSVLASSGRFKVEPGAVQLAHAGLRTEAIGNREARAVICVGFSLLIFDKYENVEHKRKYN